MDDFKTACQVCASQAQSIEELPNLVDKLQDRTNRLIDENAVLEAKIEELRQENSRYQRENDRLIVEVHTDNRIIKNLQDQVVLLQNKIGRLRSIYDDFSNHVSRLED